MKNHIATNIKFLRRMNGMSQQQLAEAINSNRGKITSYERDVATPPIDVLLLISKHFKVDLRNLIEHNYSIGEPFDSAHSTDSNHNNELRISNFTSPQSEMGRHLKDTLKQLDKINQNLIRLADILSKSLQD